MLERAGRADEAIRILGEDIARRRFLSEDTLVAYAELLARHGRLDELRELATGQDARTTLPVHARALWDHGRVREAETVMRDALAADDWDGYRAWLSSALWRAFALAGLGRAEEAVAVVEAHPDPWTDPRVVRAGLLGAAGRLADAVAEQRAAEAKTAPVPRREDGYSVEPPF
ncbi:hypothetical protein [Streptomyces sp. WAC08241]|uniref:hypothetical protein n=1 Tax=Streptomyces sp. WAC08241 TaxID=2487421 RepID=UPI0021B075DF|nr:hypothetical protein [Streptomyces sp. WAC08241]